MPRNDLKAYTSLIARIPQELADQVKRYAREHRCTISELIRDGLEMRLDTDLPWHAPGTPRDATPEVLPEVLHTLEALTPMLRTLVEDTVRATMVEVLHEVIPREGRQREAASEVVSEVIREVLPTDDKVIPGHTSTPQPPDTATNGGMTEVIKGHTKVIPQQDNTRTVRRSMTEVVPLPAAPAQLGPEGMTEVLPSQPPAAQPSREGITEILPFDTTRYRLGKLCPRSHDYRGTGKSLRTNNKAGYCLACNAEDARARRQAKRQEVPV